MYSLAIVTDYGRSLCITIKHAGHADDALLFQSEQEARDYVAKTYPVEQWVYANLVFGCDFLIAPKYVSEFCTIDDVYGICKTDVSGINPKLLPGVVLLVGVDTVHHIYISESESVLRDLCLIPGFIEACLILIVGDYATTPLNGLLTQSMKDVFEEISVEMLCTKLSRFLAEAGYEFERVTSDPVLDNSSPFDYLLVKKSKQRDFLAQEESGLREFIYHETSIREFVVWAKDIDEARGLAQDCNGVFKGEHTEGLTYIQSADGCEDWFL